MICLDGLSYRIDILYSKFSSDILIMFIFRYSVSRDLS
jgi:hypothetical protein